MPELSSKSPKLNKEISSTLGVLSVDAIERIAIPVWFLFLELQYGVGYGVLQRPATDFNFGSTYFRCRAQGVNNYRRD